jgi:ActR/RegA family two-component response regulator
VPQAGPLRVFLICPDPKLREQAEKALTELGAEVVLHQAMGVYPSGSELARALRTFSPQVVFLSFEQAETGIAVMRFLESEADGLPVVGLHRVANPALLREAMRAGAREFLAPPFRGDDVAFALQSMRALLRRAPLAYAATDHIYYLFVPAGQARGRDFDRGHERQRGDGLRIGDESPSGRPGFDQWHDPVFVETSPGSLDCGCSAACGGDGRQLVAPTGFASRRF